MPRSTDEATPRYYSYVLRFWQEASPADEPAWRGEVESIQTGQKSAIADLPPALRLIALLMAMEQQSD